MAGRASPEFLPLLLGSDEHQLFALTSRPAGAVSRHGILICPPFAEEMNRTRRTVRLLCDEAARYGMAVVSVDLHGTGDSAGDFSDARWDRWLADLGVAARWLAQQGCSSVSVLGIRAGALLAWEIARSGELAVASLLLWQPVLAGKSVVTDILRTRVAAGAALGNRESVGMLREQLNQGIPVEAAGYLLSPALAAALDGAAITPEEPHLRPRICWIEVVSDAGSAIRQTATATIASLKSAGVHVELLRVQDPPFWSTTEVTVGRATVAAMLTWLDEAS